MHTVENVTNDNKGLRDFRNFSANNISSKKSGVFHEYESRNLVQRSVRGALNYINVQAKLKQIT